MGWDNGGAFWKLATEGRESGTFKYSLRERRGMKGMCTDKELEIGLKRLW